MEDTENIIVDQPENADYREIIWGFNKRKAGDDDIHVNNPKKRKLFMMDTNIKNIYSIGEEIHFVDSISNKTIEIVIRKITKIINNKHKKYKDGTEKLTITLIISSPGGSVDAILRFVDFISMVKKKYKYVEFKSIISGNAASAATIMAVVMDRRYMTTYATAMIHQLRSGTSGKYTELISYSKHLDYLHKVLIDIYLKHTNRTREQLEELLKNETWVSSSEYLEMGFIDEII